MGKDTTVEAPKPDPMIGQAAAANIELGNKWLDQSKEQYAEGLKRQDITDALTGKVVDQQLATQAQANQWAQQDRARTTGIYQPMQDQYAQVANNFDSQANQDAAAATARAGIATSADAQQGAADRNMLSMGINPNSGRFAGINRAGDTATALGEAGAANAARAQLRSQAISLKGDAINMGNGLASSAAAAYGIGTGAGNSAVGNNQSSNGNFYANGAQMNAGYQGNIGANTAAGGILNTQYGIDTSGANARNAIGAQNNATTMGGIGSLAGAGVSLFL
jgi:hypothetical protein